MSQSDRRPKPRRRVFEIALAIAAIALVAAGLQHLFDSEGERPAPRPTGTIDDILALRDRDDLNVLFVLVDTLRADRLGSYGYERDTSPNIDALAETGLRFAQQVSQSSWTKCSMSSLWTGLYPARTRSLRAYDVISDAATMPAEIFQEAGFRTAAVWRNGWIAPNFGFAQGFEIYLSPRGRRGPHLNRVDNPNIALEGSDANVIDSAREFLRVNGHERWFLYLHMMDVHQYAYSEDTALFGVAYSDSYDNSIRWVDSLLGHLFEDLDQQGLRERTVVVFSADHGEAFGEHGSEGHAHDVYGEVTTTPWIVSFPFRLEPGIVVEARSENVDLWPTVLEIVGLRRSPIRTDNLSCLRSSLRRGVRRTTTQKGSRSPTSIRVGGENNSRRDRWSPSTRGAGACSIAHTRQILQSSTTSGKTLVSRRTSPTTRQRCSRISRRRPKPISRVALRPGATTHPPSRSTRCS
jgi:hypothetical protein